MSVAVAAGLLTGYAIDAAVGDPRRFHPVAGFGTLAGRLEEATYRDDRGIGVRYVAVLVGGVAVVTALLDRLARRHPLRRLALTAALGWASLGGTTLIREASALGSALAAGDVHAARRRLPSLCGRDPSTLDESDLVRATVESLAENTSDAVVGPLVWGAVGGPAGIAAYRAVNTLDAMVGYRTSRYERFGWAAARLDDLANWVPARLCALLTVLVAGVVGGRPAAAARVWRDDAGGHPSPNAGPVEAAFAGALGVTLGGSANRYGDHVDVRPPMGDGPPPALGDVARAVALSRAVSVVALAVCVTVVATRGR